MELGSLDSTGRFCNKTSLTPNSLTPEIQKFCEGFCVQSEVERTKTEQKLRISRVAELRS